MIFFLNKFVICPPTGLKFIIDFDYFSPATELEESLLVRSWKVPGFL